jgi:hypothetical protein
VHHIPPKPAYLRVKTWRRLQRLGAIPVKNSVYALPATDQAQEDFQWVARTIVEGGGEAMVCHARLLDGLADDQVEALFQAARDADYAAIVEEASRVVRDARGEMAHDGGAVRLGRRLAEVVAIDFFGASGRSAAEQAVAALAESRAGGGRRARKGHVDPADLRGRVWITRRGIHVDRMASAWLIRRFVDPKARFKFVGDKTYEPRRNEIRFDMFQAEFTHDGDRCTFEVLLDRLGLDDRALRTLAEIVHDIDLKDAKFGRPEAPGIDRLIAGIAMSHRDDETRLARGAAVFEDLYGYFSRKRGG